MPVGVRAGLGDAVPGGVVTRVLDGLGVGPEAPGDGALVLRCDGEGDGAGRVGDGVTGAGRDGAG
ncbi:MAG: hypothetical protein ACRDRJ_49285, partial [Streptosporangiaceae bacterium]